jgi:hypothetical protein
MACGPMRSQGERRSIAVSNEFASIEIRTETCGNGNVVVIHDRRTGEARRVDLLVLSWLVALPEDVMQRLPDPGVMEPRDHIG